jgi:hypothetical protein
LAIVLLIANATGKNDDCRFENKTGEEKKEDKKSF